jgi:hypothetical protein
VKDLDENSDKFLYSIDQMRIQRHDFMNYLQVIYGYIQIGKPQEVVSYIKNINNKMAVLGNVFNLDNPEIALILQEFFANCSKNGIEFEFYTELEYISCDLFSKNINVARKTFNEALEILINNKNDSTGSPLKLNMCINESLVEIIFIIGISSKVIDSIEDINSNGCSEPLYCSIEEDSKISIYKGNGIFEALVIRFNKNHI